jgi:phage protein U
MAKQSPQIVWGGVEFTIDTLAINDIKRNRTWRWAKHDRISASTVYQFIGEGPDEISLTGEANHLIGGSMFQSDKLVSIANEGKAKILVVAGKNLGKYMLHSLGDGFGNVIDDGKAITNKFTLKLVRYNE